MTDLLHPVRPSARPPSEVDSGDRSAVALGIRDMLPWLWGVVPFGLAVGAAAAAADLPPAAGLATGPTIYSGSAQLAALGLLDAGAGTLAVVITVLVVNLRLVFYGAAIAPRWAGASRRWRALAAYLLVDPSYAVGSRRVLGSPGATRAHYLGAGITLWVAWHGALVVGALAGDRLPAALPLALVVPLFLLAEVTDGARSAPGVAAAVVGGLVGILGGPLPLHSGVVAAIVLGVGAAVAMDGRRGR